VKILDLANQMIAFSRNGAESTMRIVFTGLRPGERMHELLVGSRERSGPTSHPLIDVLLPDPEAAGPAAGRDDFRDRLKFLLALGQAHADRVTVIEGMRPFLPTYEPFSLDESEAGPFMAGANGHEGQGGDVDAKLAGCSKVELSNPETGEGSEAVA
jgi:hypothetical protein